MAISLSATEKTQIQYAIDLMVKGQAYETPFDSQAIESVARAAAATGFVTSDGDFKQKVLLNPFSTLLSFILFVGA
jgi:hypothetical protein